ncbi:hypothetical protein AVEN_158762-1 [Araneus ventricosus]|uniref:Uncharacterized protein n=1 Tax=Araneus ventricosus TaxID=182803 RepID=A0A4Y2MIT6_ARAVE|nr:hypothetical protein AVEN_158762-1 [Araneus ventricosus]
MFGEENGEKPFYQQNSFKPSNIRKKSENKTDIFYSVVSGLSPLHVIRGETVNAKRYRSGILHSDVRNFRAEVSPDLDDNAHLHRAGLTEQNVVLVPVTRPVTDRFDGQDAGILFKKFKINKKKEMYTLCTAQAFSLLHY